MTSRFAPLQPTQLGPEALALHEAILRSRGAVANEIGLIGKDGSMRGPFAPLLRTPASGDLVQRLGISVRADATLPPAVLAVTILTVVRELGCVFEWEAHRQLSVTSGALLIDDVDHIGAGKPPVAEELQLAWAFALQESRHRCVDQATLSALEARFGERAIVELTLLTGYYTLICMLMRNCAPVTGETATELRGD